MNADSIGYTTRSEAREQGRLSALAGRPVFANPHVGVDADAWFDGYHSVPEAEIGSQPELQTAFRQQRNGGQRRGKRTGLPRIVIRKASMAEGPHR